jgi:histidinol-phosphate aminotransferase
VSVSRRSFLRALGGTAAALPFVSARGLEAQSAGMPWRPVLAPMIRLDSNENPNGPAPEALRAITEAFSESNRYPDFHTEQLLATIARHFGVPQTQILLGCGSTETLKVAVEAFVTSERRLVTAAPTFEQVSTTATQLGLPSIAVPVDQALRLDLDAMIAASAGAGLVFLCNPNNPTSTVHGADTMRGAIDRILKASPDVIVLVDEAYHEYVDDPSYQSMLPLALAEPRVLVSRTFSKIHGMAGLRLGFAVGRPETLQRMRRHVVPLGVNVLAAAAATTSLGLSGHVEQEHAGNLEAKRFTVGFFESAGYTVAPSEANFIMADIRRSVVGFREACRKKDVLIGRPFPPLTNYARVTIGTMEEMKMATGVFREVLTTMGG